MLDGRCDHKHQLTTYFNPLRTGRLWTTDRLPLAFQQSTGYSNLNRSPKGGLIGIVQRDDQTLAIETHRHPIGNSKFILQIDDQATLVDGPGGNVEPIGHHLAGR